jgi:AraC-like DNA-binding protein
MEPNTPTLESIAKLVEAQGLAVFDITQMPVYGEPIIAPYVVIALNNHGWIRSEYDFEPDLFGEHDFTLLNPGHVMVPLETSNDYHATLLVMSHRFYEYLAEMFPENYKYVHYFQTTFHLTDKQYEGISSCLQMMKLLSTLDHPFREKLLTSQIDIMAHLTEVYCTENGFVPEEKSGVDFLILRFHEAIAQNYAKHRDVKFYADLLCLSPKYFGTIVRQTLGYSAGEQIARYVMVRAKNLLRHHRKLSIQQVSDRLGFSDQTAFARFFKNHSGQTPQEYREGKKKELEKPSLREEG